MLCREHAVQLHRAKERIERAGARLVAVGSGRPAFVAGFREATGFDGEILCDPGLRSYRAAGLKRGLARTLGPRAWRAGRRALGGGFRQGATRGDPWQQGGVFVVATGGHVAYAHVSEHAGDNAPVEHVLAAVESLAR